MNPNRTLLRTIVPVVAAALVTASCGSDDTTGPPENPAITVAVSPTSVTLDPGSSETVDLTITRTGGFTGAVTVSASGLPTGVSASDVAIASGATTGTLTLNASPGADAGTATATLTASGTGVTSQTASLSVTVNEAAPAGGFTLSVNPSPLSVQAGDSATATVKVARTGSFTGAVDLSVSGLPTGLTASFSPASVTDSTSTLTLEADSSVSADTVDVTIAGGAAGVDSATATLSVQLAAVSSGGGSGNVTWNFCGDAPLWAAVKAGSGAWTQVTGSGGTYSFDVGSGTGSLAWVTGSAAGGYDLHVVQATAAELTTEGSAMCPGGVTSGKTVNGSVAGLSATDIAQISLGSSTTTLSGATGSDFTLTNVPPGSVDLVAGRSSLSGSSLTLQDLIIRRDLQPADNATLDTLDFGSSEAFAPESHTVTVTNLNGEQVFASMLFHTANGSTGAYATGLPGTSGTLTVPEIPSDQLSSGDFQLVNVVVVDSTTGATRTAGAVFSSPGDQSVALGPTLTGVDATTLATTPYARIQLVVPLPSDYGQMALANFTQGSGSSSRAVTIQQTEGYLAGADTATLAVPDLSGVSGWDDAWGLAAGVSTDWTAWAFGWSGTGGILGQPFAEGVTTSSASATGTITP